MNLRRFPAAAVVLFLLLSHVLTPTANAGPMQDLYKSYAKIGDCRKLVKSMLGSAEKREDNRSVELTGKTCEEHLEKFRGHLSKFGEASKSSENRKIVRDEKSSSVAHTKNAINFSRETQANAKSQKKTKPALENLSKKLGELDGEFESYQEKINRYYTKLEKMVEEKTRRWNQARQDDETDYKKAVLELSSRTSLMGKVLSEGYQLTLVVKKASEDWSRANRTGDKELIAKAYENYYRASTELDEWQQKEWGRYAADYAPLLKEEDRAWSKFVSETKESFKLYDGEVEKANYRLYDFKYHMLGER